MPDERGQVSEQSNQDEVTSEVEEGGGQGAFEAMPGYGGFDIRKGEGRRGEGEGGRRVRTKKNVAIWGLSHVVGDAGGRRRG